MMPVTRHIPRRLAFIGLCLTLPAFPGLSQNAQTSTETAPQAAPLTAQTAAQTAAQATGTDTPAAPSLWASPADLVQDEPITISPARVSPARSGETDILSCPFEALRAAYLSLYEDTDALNVAALESEVFKVCIARQKQVKQLLDFEARLRTQLGDVVSASMNTRVIAPRVIAPRVIVPRVIVPRVIGVPSEPEIAEEQQDTPPPETFRETKSAALNQSTLPQCADRYTSGPVFGAATLDGGLHAVVFDALSGTRLTVKVGDTLPGGVTIARISTEDGVIILEQDEERRLARRLTKPAFDDGGGLLFKTVSFADVYKPDSPASGTSDSNWEALK